MPDHAGHARNISAQLMIKLVDRLVYGKYRKIRIYAAMIVDDQPDRRLAHANIVDVRDRAAFFGAPFQRGENMLARRRIDIASGELGRFQRLDMAFDFYRAAELPLDRVFEVGGDLMRLTV